jgi:hypothetical protein
MIKKLLEAMFLAEEMFGGKVYADANHDPEGEWDYLSINVETTKSDVKELVELQYEWYRKTIDWFGDETFYVTINIIPGEEVCQG